MFILLIFLGILAAAFLRYISQQQRHESVAADIQTERSDTSASLSIRAVDVSSYTITVRVRSTGAEYQVSISANSTIGMLIDNVCQQANLEGPSDHYYLMFDTYELDVNHTIQQSGLLGALSTFPVNHPELRLKFTHQLEESPHLGTHIILASPEQLIYSEILHIPSPSTQEHIMPNILRPVAKKLAQHKSKSPAGSTLIAMPIFTQKVIDMLPTLEITVPLKPTEFNWNHLLECLAVDLEINKNDMFIINASEGSTKWRIKLAAKISRSKEKIKKIRQKLCVLVFPTSKSAQFIAEQQSSGSVTEIKGIEAVLNDYFENKDPCMSDTILSPDDIDIALKLNEQPAIIDPPAWEFLTKKSREITMCVLHAFQLSSVEYVIDNMALIHNEQLYQTYSTCSIHDNEKILFHGTRTTNFDSIFENNFQNKFVGSATDSGWYGRGFYFSSSPKYCANYAKSPSGSLTYLVCSLVKLGKIFCVKDMSYQGKEMRADSDSHYVKVTDSGYPTEVEHSFYEEFVAKKSNQILPLYIIGLRRVNRFVIWRDAKITNSHNAALFEQMKQRYNFNIYGSETTDEALGILKCKLIDGAMQCIVVTNGADNGEHFARQCRELRSSTPIIVYCMNVNYHNQWATSIVGEPRIKVTGNSQDVFEFINNVFSVVSTSHD